MPVVVASSSSSPPPPHLPESDITWEAPQPGQQFRLLRGLLTTHTSYWLLLTALIVIFSLLVVATRIPSLPLIHKRTSLLHSGEQRGGKKNHLKDSLRHKQHPHLPRKESDSTSLSTAGWPSSTKAEGQPRLYQHQGLLPTGSGLLKMTGDETSRGISNISTSKSTRVATTGEEPSLFTRDTAVENLNDTPSDRRYSPIHATPTAGSSGAFSSTSFLSNPSGNQDMAGHDDGRNPKSGKGPSAADATATDAAAGFPFVAHHRPPPPPLTPPTLSASIFYLEERSRPGYAASIPPNMETDPQVAFMYQPNPDYITDVVLTDDAAGASGEPSTARSTSGSPQRRSYARMIPIPRGPAASAIGSPQSANDGLASSFPPTSPQLPPPPPLTSFAPGEVEDDQMGKMLVGEGDDGEVAREIGVRGEIISVLDDAGAGWKRHTRVYGGGVCLACLAAENGGGFYGENVPLEDRRY